MLKNVGNTSTGFCKPGDFEAEMFLGKSSKNERFCDFVLEIFFAKSSNSVSKFRFFLVFVLILLVTSS